MISGPEYIRRTCCYANELDRRLTLQGRIQEFWIGAPENQRKCLDKSGNLKKVEENILEHKICQMQKQRDLSSYL